MNEVMGQDPAPEVGPEVGRPAGDAGAPAPAAGQGAPTDPSAAPGAGGPDGDHPTPPPPGGPVRVAIHAFATGPLRQGASIERQVEAAAAYAETRWSPPFVILVDAFRGGAPAWDPDGPGSPLEAAARDGISVVVVDDLQRFARHVGDPVAAIERMRAAGLTLHCALAGREVHLAELVQAGLCAAAARERMRALFAIGRAQLASRGGVPHRPAFGYRAGAVRGYPEIDEAEAAVVRRVFAMADGGCAVGRIAATLASEGVPGPAGARGWSGGTIRRMLGRSLYVGRVTYVEVTTVHYGIGDEGPARVRRGPGRVRSVSVEHYRIIDDALYDRVVAARRARRR